MKRSLLLAMVCAFIFIGGNVQGSTITGFIWDPGDPNAANPSLGSAGLGPATATFTVDQLNFDTRLFATPTYDLFLSGGAGNPNNLSWISDPSNIKNTFYTTTPMLGTLFEFTGMMNVTQGMTLTLTHDDGFYLKVGDTTFDYSTPVAPTTTQLTLNMSTGTYQFELFYGAVNSTPEVLIADLKAVPEPTTIFLLGSGLIGLAAYGRKKLFKK